MLFTLTQKIVEIPVIDVCSSCLGSGCPRCHNQGTVQKLVRVRADR